MLGSSLRTSGQGPHGNDHSGHRMDRDNDQSFIRLHLMLDLRAQAPSPPYTCLTVQLTPDRGCGPLCGSLFLGDFVIMTSTAGEGNTKKAA